MSLARLANPTRVPSLLAALALVPVGACRPLVPNAAGRTERLSVVTGRGGGVVEIEAATGRVLRTGMPAGERPWQVAAGGTGRRSCSRSERRGNTGGEVGVRLGLGPASEGHVYPFRPHQELTPAGQEGRDPPDRGASIGACRARLGTLGRLTSRGGEANVPSPVLELGLAPDAALEDAPDAA